MAVPTYATLGRATDNDVQIDHPTVSSHHARLSWVGASLQLEDLSSANGSFADGQRIEHSARIRPGSELRLGQAIVPWSHPGLRQLLKAGVGSRTLVMPAVASTSSLCLVCGGCGVVTEMPRGPVAKTLTCAHCGATLRTTTKPRGQGSSSSSRLLTAVLVAGSAGLAYAAWQRLGLQALPTSASDLEAKLALAGELDPGTPTKIAAALTPTEAVTRNAAIKFAARAQGPYHVEQVAEIWNAVRAAWRYVNDPRGREYFATASETIRNGYVGDCDDFATTLAAMVLAIGGNARVVVMNAAEGGHAYAEVCVPSEPSKLAKQLAGYYRTRWKPYLRGREVPSAMAYRSSDDCPTWLNLDWNSIVPGGPYQAEEWAVAIYEDGHAEQLLAASPAHLVSPARKASSQPK